MKLRFLGAAAALILACAAPAAAQAQNAYATGNVNMRAGPGTQYPVITTVQRGSPVTIFGCLRGWSWCDTAWRGARGWVSGRYLEALYEGRRVYVPNYGASLGYPIITFQFGNYWDRYYRDRPFYRHRDRWHGPRRDWDGPRRDHWHGPRRDWDGDWDGDRRSDRRGSEWRRQRNFADCMNRQGHLTCR